jgi:hypothetical protein
MTQTSRYSIYNPFDPGQQKADEYKSALVFSIFLFSSIETNNLILPDNGIIISG